MFRKISISLIIIVIACVILSFLDFQITLPTAILTKTYTLFLIDISPSTDGYETKELVEWLGKEFRNIKTDFVGAAVFNNSFKLIIPFIEKFKITNAKELLETLYRGLESQRKVLRKNITDIESSLASCVKYINSFNGAKRIILLTDGIQTKGDVLEYIKKLDTKNISIFPVVLNSKARDLIYISKISFPNVIRSSEKFSIYSIISSNNDFYENIKNKLEVTLELRQDDNSIHKSRFTLFPGGNKAVTISNIVQEKSISKYELVVTSTNFSDKFIKNNSATFYIKKISDKPNICYFWESKNNSYLLKGNNDDFEIEDIKLTNFLTTANYQEIIFNKCQGIILDNISAKAMPDSFVAVLKKSAEELAKGILFIGGNQSFGLSKYEETEVEKIIPVNSNPPNQISFIILLDASGSMSEEIDNRPKFEYAIDTLKNVFKSSFHKNDYVGILGFSNSVINILEPDRFEINQSKIDTIGNLTPYGSTYVLPALEQGLSYLRRMNTKEKVFVIISDGKFMDKLENLKRTIDDLQSQGIDILFYATTSPSDATSYFSKIAEAKKLRVFSDFQELAKELKQIIERKRPLKKEGKFDLINTGFLFEGITTYPTLYFYNLTSLKQRAVLEMKIDDYPAVVHWRVGSGNIAAWLFSLENITKTKSLEELFKKQISFLIQKQLNHPDIKFDAEFENDLLHIKLEQIGQNTKQTKLVKNDIIYVDILNENFTRISAAKLRRINKTEFVGTIQVPESFGGNGFIRYIRNWEKDKQKKMLNNTHNIYPLNFIFNKELFRLTPDISLLRLIAEKTNGSCFEFPAKLKMTATNLRGYEKSSVLFIFLALLILSLHIIYNIFTRKSN